MSEQTQRALLAAEWDGPSERANGLGIRYVKSLLEMAYGEGARLQIESALERGTTVTILLPAEKTS